MSLAWNFRKWHCRIERIRLRPLPPNKQELLLLMLMVLAGWLLCWSHVGSLMQLHLARKSQRSSLVSGSIHWLLAVLSQLSVTWPLLLQEARLAALYCGFRVRFQLTKLKLQRSLRTWPWESYNVISDTFLSQVPYWLKGWINRLYFLEREVKHWKEEFFPEHVKFLVSFCRLSQQLCDLRQTS